MSTYKVINTGLTDQIVAQIQIQINQTRTLMPFLISLNKSEKAALAKIGKKRYAWSKEAFEYAQLFPQVMPQNRSFVSFDKVKRDYEILGPIFKNLSILYRALADTMTQLGANYYQHARDMYDATNDPANEGEPGILVAREELAKQFENQGLKTEPVENIEDALGGNSNSNSNGDDGNGGGNNNGGPGMPLIPGSQPKA
jgi:hypothetical protein